MFARVQNGLKVALVLSSLIAPHFSFADDPTIFDVRKNLVMADDDPVFRDFYINGGTEAGLQRGMIVNVLRRVTLYDNIQNRSPGELNAVVGQVKIIHVQKGLAVGRAHGESNRENQPLLEDDFVMIGDKIDVKSATMEGKKSARNIPDENPSRRSASAESALKLEIKATNFSSTAPTPAPEAQKASILPSQPLPPATAEPVSLPSAQ